MTQRKIALSIEEAADYTGIGRNTLRQLVEWKKLPVLKVGRKVLIKTDRNRQRFYQTEAMIYLHARRLYHVLLLIRNQELMFVKERRM